MTATPRRALVVTAAAALSLTTSLALTGCFGNPLDQLTDKIAEGSAQQGAEKLIEGMTGGDLDIDLGGELPDDFPSEVPLIDGKVITSTAMTIDDGRSWMVNLSVKDGKAAAEEARAALTSAGFEETVWSDLGEMKSGNFSNGTYSVSLAVFLDETEPTIGYTVLQGAKE
jgi:hypothetical protein